MIKIMYVKQGYLARIKKQVTNINTQILKLLIKMGFLDQITMFCGFPLQSAAPPRMC